MPNGVEYQTLAALAVIRQYIVSNLDELGMPAVAKYAQLADVLETHMGIE